MGLEAEEAAVAAGLMYCASCGKAEVDDVKLKKCGCDLVKYCNINCQKNHRPQHKKACKKRLAELRDKQLFTMPDENYLGECPLCCLPMPIDPSKSTFMGCCSKTICNGCNYDNKKREHEAGLEVRCAFCREPLPRTEEECDKRIMKRIKKNCPDAMAEMGGKHCHQGDYDKAFEYLTKAANFGDASAHYNLSVMYFNGEGVEKNEKKHIYHLEEAAIAGHPRARYNIGFEEVENGRFERGRKHFIIAANLGHDESLKALMALYKDGYASKEDYADALRAYQAAVEATKSSGRERAEEAMKIGEVEQT